MCVPSRLLQNEIFLRTNFHLGGGMTEFIEGTVRSLFLNDAALSGGEVRARVDSQLWLQ